MIHPSAIIHTEKYLISPSTPIALGRMTAEDNRAPFRLGEPTVPMTLRVGTGCAARGAIAGLMGMDL